MLKTTPLEIATALEGAALQTFASLESLREAAKLDAELQKNVVDCESFAWLGRYYAAKIRGASALALFDATGDSFFNTNEFVTGLTFSTKGASQP